MTALGTVIETHSVNTKKLPAAIYATELESLSGLSDRRHRQLAKDGYFPAPVNGEYLLAQTIRGLFKYYQTRDLGGQLQTVKLEREKDKARKDRVEADEAEQQVVRKAVVKQSMIKFVVGLKAKQQVLPRRLGNEFAMLNDSVEIETRLKDALRESWESLTFDGDDMQCPGCKRKL